MKKIEGIAASTGIAVAKAYELTLPDLSFEKVTIQHPDKEINRLNQALATAIQELEKIKEHTEQQLDAEHAVIFSAHILVLNDPELIDPIKENITTNNINAEASLDETASMFIDLFQNMDNEYMRERAAD